MPEQDTPDLEPAAARGGAHRLRATLAVLGVLAATVLGAALTLQTYSQQQQLSVGTIGMHVDVGHRGALDLYVPLVDWGIRFNAVRLPVRLKIEARSVDRNALSGAAAGDLPAVHQLREELTDALRSYLLRLLLITAVVSLLSGLTAALALRSAHAAPVRRLLITAAAGAAVTTVTLLMLLPPRGDLTQPEYYANGPDIPVALEALQTVKKSTDTLSDEADTQLVSLAQIVNGPAQRASVERKPKLVVASDLHNNVLALPTLERAGRDATVLFAGDLTDRGTPLEIDIVRRMVRTGGRFVAIAGNHDSDTSMRELAANGAVVLTRYGQLNPDSAIPGPVVVTVDGVRVAGYDSPNQRVAASNYQDNGADITAADQEQFTAWAKLLLRAQRVDVLMVHEPELARPLLSWLRRQPGTHKPVIVTGHTHKQQITDVRGVLHVNGGTLGAGGTGSIGEMHADRIGFAVIRHSRKPFRPVAVDGVQIDPSTGSANAQRLRVR